MDTLDGTVSCSVVIDPDVVRRAFAIHAPGAAPDLISAEEFWADGIHALACRSPAVSKIWSFMSCTSARWDSARPAPAILSDAMALPRSLGRLGVNAVELLPMAEFSGNVAWGYGDSHHFCIESSAGGRDKYRHFVRECHRRGIAVIQDVVYNHYDNEAERARVAIRLDRP